MSRIESALVFDLSTPHAERKALWRDVAGGIHELPREVRELQSRCPRTLLDVRAGAVPTLDDFIEQVWNSHRGKLRRELARVLRTHTIVLRRRPDERLRILPAWPDVVIRRDRSEELTL